MSELESKLEAPEASYAYPARARLHQILHRWGSALDPADKNVVVVARPDIPTERWERIKGDLFQLCVGLPR